MPEGVKEPQFFNTFYDKGIDGTRGISGMRAAIALS